MIINGGSRSNWRFFAKHLVKATENEQVTPIEFRGLAAESVLEALREMDALASASRCKNFFYHANLNPRAHEILTDRQWEVAVDVLESKLGLAGHSRFVIEHVKEGRQHRHVIWSRINPDTTTTRSDSRNFAAHEHAARILEEQFGHAATKGAHGRDGERPERRPESWETFRGHQSGIDPAAVAREVTELWHQSDSGQAFVAALQDRGYTLCKGDRRDFCLIDRAGQVHSLARRVKGVKAAGIRARLADVAPDTLPSIAEGKQQALKAADAVEKAAATASPATSPTPEPTPEPTPVPATPLDRFAKVMTETLRSNAGEPHYGDGMSWIDRSIAVLSAARDSVTDWVKGRWQDLVSQFRGPKPGHDDPAQER